MSVFVCLFFFLLLAGTMPDDVKPTKPSSGSSGSVSGASGFPLKAPDYAGEGLFSRFSADFDTFCTIHNFNDELKLRFLPLCLSGVARDAIETIPTDSRGTYANAIKALSDNFGKPRALDAHAKLRDLRFESSLSLDAFVIKFKHLMSQAFPGQSSGQVLFHTFLPTLPSRYQEHIIAQGISDFDEAVRRVRNLVQSERFQQPESRVARDQPVRQVSTPEADRLEQILHVEVLERRLSAGGGSGLGGATGGSGADSRARRGG